MALLPADGGPLKFTDTWMVVDWPAVIVPLAGVMFRPAGVVTVKLTVPLCAVSTNAEA